MIPVKVTNGKGNYELLDDYFHGKKPGTYWVRVEMPSRSLQQNRYYWLCLNIIADSTGHDANSLHEIFKRLFLPAKIISYRDKAIKVPGSTTDLSKSDFVEYMDRILAEAGEQGIVLPQPEKEGLK